MSWWASVALLGSSMSLALATAGSATAPDPIPGTCAVTPGDSRFVFRSGFWLNLHNFLHRDAKARRGIQDEVPAALSVASEDTIGGRALTSRERLIWDAAVQVYLSNPLASGRADSVVSLLNERLAAAVENGGLRDVDIDPAVRQALLDAAPVYRAVWWPVHDRRNQAWIASLQALLTPREACLARFLENAFAADWPRTPIVVDASVYASWFGAYMTQNPVHITLSSNAHGNQGSLGVETLLHEAGHSLTGSLDSALAATAARAHRVLPRELEHLVLFYTAGEAVRDQVPAHLPYAQVFRLWEQNATAQKYRALLESEWLPHLQGRRSFAEAIARLVERLPRRPM